MAAPIHLIITSLAVGGMEKRLLEIWQKLVRDGCDLGLVIPEATYLRLRERPELSSLAQLESRIRRYRPASGSFWGILRSLWPIVRTFPAGTSVHYLLLAFPFVHRLLGHHVLLSWVATTLPPFRMERSAFSYWFMSRLSFRQADVIDVLNPIVEEQLARKRGLRAKLRVTAGGTFVDLDHFQPADRKDDRIVFLGRLERAKGALRFVEAVPHIVRRLAEQGRSARFQLFGSGGDEENAIRQLLATSPFSTLPIELGYAEDPRAVLAPAKVFVSLQSVSNYPSKALAEAMACGCVPVVTDTGETRLMTGEAPAEFVAGNFTPEDLAGAINRILAAPTELFDQRSRLVRRHAEARFGIDVQARYFRSVYGLEGPEGLNPVADSSGSRPWTGAET